MENNRSVLTPISIFVLAGSVVLHGLITGGSLLRLSASVNSLPDHIRTEVDLGFPWRMLIPREDD